MLKNDGSFEHSWCQMRVIESASERVREPVSKQTKERVYDGVTIQAR